MDKRRITPWREILPNDWTEASVVALPEKVSKEPRILVRRKEGRLKDGLGNELISFAGPTAISLFTGCGGMDIGMERAGFVTLLQHEWAECACLTLIGNRPRYFRHAALIQGDIRKTSTWMILKEAGVRIGDCHVITGGPPCQGFSYSNSNRGKGHDERNDLVFEFLRVIREAQPRFFIFENVPGFMELNGGKYFESFLKRAYVSGYELVYGLINAVEYLVPQDRCRFICSGTRRDLANCDGQLAALPAPACFGKRDRKILSMEGNEEEKALLRCAPGIRYFPNRPILRPPDPITPGRDIDTGRAKNFLEFMRRIKKEEPDRIIEQRSE